MSNFTVPGENRGSKSRYLSGGGSLLLSGLPPIEPDNQDGCWSRDELEAMNARFVAALEQAFAAGLEHRKSARREVKLPATRTVRLSIPLPPAVWIGLLRSAESALVMMSRRS